MYMYVYMCICIHGVYGACLCVYVYGVCVYGVCARVRARVCMRVYGVCACVCVFMACVYGVYMACMYICIYLYV